MAIFWGEKLWRNKGEKAGWKLLCGKKAKFLEENKIQVYLAYRLLAAQIGLNHLSLPYPDNNALYFSITLSGRHISCGIKVLLHLRPIVLGPLSSIVGLNGTLEIKLYRCVLRFVQKKASSKFILLLLLLLQALLLLLQAFLLLLTKF